MRSVSNSCSKVKVREKKKSDTGRLRRLHEGGQKVEIPKKK